MSDSKKEQEDLKKLEDQAYFELCQIIAEAMQYQDIELLNARIADWKNKYKKLLDRPSTSSKSDFKKRIEYLLTQYYSEITKYILDRLRLKEEKKIENQAKALRQLYRIIKETDDYDLLKKKVAAWKEKYPVTSFLNMYQKRIEYYTRDKNLRENAFKQEEAFKDLVDITKIHGTFDELKKEISLWEQKYSINDKYSIDDFLNHQSEIKRYTSDEYLQDIAREDIKTNNADKTDLDMVEEYNNKAFSDLSVQAGSYATLLSISKSPNSINDMFKWVYKNRNIKFNDKYKELILTATCLDYSPSYLNKLDIPNMDISKNSLSYEEYKNIADIKRYAIISYFNLLLPPDKRLSNDYFSKHIQTVYAKSEKARTTSKMENPSLHIDNVLDSGTGISLANPNEVVLEQDTPINENLDETIENISPDVLDEIVDETSKESIDKIEMVLPESNDKDEENSFEQVLDETTVNENVEDLNEIANEAAKKVLDKSVMDISENTNEPKPKVSEEVLDEIVVQASEEILDEANYETTKKPLINDTNDSTTKTDEEHLQTEPVIDSFETEGVPTNDMISVSIQTDDAETISDETIDEPKKELDQTTIVALSPLFIEAVNDLNKQAEIVNHIDIDTNNHIESEKNNELLESISFTKTKTE